MLRFALKNMAIKKAQTLLVILSVVISASIAVLAYNVASQVSDGITENAGYYSVIVGPAGSKTQLAMNTMYFADEPLGTISYDVVETLLQDFRVTDVIPFAMADSYNGYKVVGTSPVFLNARRLTAGTLFGDGEAGSVVVGANVARYCNLRVGDTIYTSHAVGGATHDEGLTVVGILAASHSPYDNVLFTDIHTLWELHDHGEEGDGEHEHTHGTVCAVLINTKNPAQAMQLQTEYDGKILLHDGDSYSLQAIEPMAVVRDVLADADDTKYIVFVLCAVILLMNVMIVSIITLLNMLTSAKEIALMRLIGISMKRINLLYLIQNGIVGLFSTVIAFVLSKLLLVFMNGYVADMGVVLNLTRVYPLELLILVGVFFISLLPTAICTFTMSKKDSVGEYRDEKEYYKKAYGLPFAPRYASVGIRRLR